MKLFINSQPIVGPWGGGAHWINAFHKYAFDYALSTKFDKNKQILICTNLDNVKVASKYRFVGNNNSKIVLRVNENDARKGTNHVDDAWLNCMQQADGVVFVSNWLKEYYNQKGWKNLYNNDTVIFNGVDSEIFKKNEKINNNKINIVTHHWSSNKLKGESTHLFLDDFVRRHSDEYTYTYIGRIDVSLPNSKVIQPICGKALGDELGRYDVYITATHADPAPNHVIESISCEIPTYAKFDGGGAVELVGNDHVWTTHDELEKLLLSKQFTKNDRKLLTWKESIQRYVDYFDTL